MQQTLPRIRASNKHFLGYEPGWTTRPVQLVIPLEIGIDQGGEDVED
jgi:hypothetical protein